MNTRTSWLVHSVFLLIVGLSSLYIWHIYVAQPTRVEIDLRDPRQIDGTQGIDPDGIWFDGSTHIQVERFGDMPWRDVHWRWRQPPGAVLPITVQVDAYTWQATTSERWRVVHLLMPPRATMVHVMSETRQVAGDSRHLGVMMSSMHMRRLLPDWYALPPWLFMLGMVGNYVLVIVAAALWLWRARWLGIAVLMCFVVLYITLIAQEAAQGFAQPTLLTDHTGRYLVSAVMLVWAWRQRTRRIDDTVITGRRFGLDVLRAAAIMSVFATHFTPLVFASWSSERMIFRWFVMFGSLGVNMFFALSGYLIGAILLRHMAHIQSFAVIQRFWARRWLRTLPAAYVSAAVLWLVATPHNVRDYWASILFVGTINPLHISSEIPFWWSLGAEELFYLVFPLLLFGLAQRVSQRWILVIGLSGIVVVSWINRVWLMSQIPQTAWEAIEFAIYTRLDSMVWGITMAWMRNARPQWFQRLAQVGFAPGMVMMAIGMMLFLDHQRWPEAAVMLSHVCMTIGAALLIPACEYLSTLGWRAIDRVVAWIAVISYSLYLYHVMVMLRLSRDIGEATSWPMLGTNALLYVVGSFGLAAASYYLVEKPILAWRDQRIRDQ